MLRSGLAAGVSIERLPASCIQPGLAGYVRRLCLQPDPGLHLPPRPAPRKPIEEVVLFLFSPFFKGKFTGYVSVFVTKSSVFSTQFTGIASVFEPKLWFRPP